jgi:hypothetical protein
MTGLVGERRAPDVMEEEDPVNMPLRLACR